MIIIIDEKERDILIEALLTELSDMKEKLEFDEGVGRKLSVKLDKEYINDIKKLLNKLGVKNKYEIL